MNSTENRGLTKRKKMVDNYSPLHLIRMYRQREKAKGAQPYRIDWGDFSPKSVEMRSRGPGWRQQEKVKRESQTPRLLFREEARRRAARLKELGPGTYDVPDGVGAVGRKPGSIRGVIASRDKRFKEWCSDTPGPGSYGKGGTPAAAWEEFNNRSAGNTGMMEGGGKYVPPPGGSGIAPNRYETNSSSVQQLLAKVTSLRGPYDTFSTDRGQYNVGYLAKGKSPYLGNEIGFNNHFLDKWSDDYHRVHGKFGKYAQYPKRPTDRMFLVDPVLAWKDPSFPAPGKYNPASPQQDSPNHDPPPFLTSSSRDDKKSMQLFLGYPNPVAVGRYMPEKSEANKVVNGYASAFLSKTQPPDMKSFLALNERIRAKNQLPHERDHLVEPPRAEDTIRQTKSLQPWQKA